MSDATADDRFPIEHLRRRIGQAGFVLAAIGLSASVALFLLNHRDASTLVLMATVSVLLAMPIVNVVAVLAEELRRRDWGFASLALAVLALLGWAVVNKVVQALQYKSL